MNTKNNNQSTSVKSQEIWLRRAEVEHLHTFGYSASEIAEKLGVDVRTIGRDIQENRRERLSMLVDGDRNGAKNWLRNQLSDYIAFMDTAQKTFCQQSESFTTEAARARSLWFAVQIANQKVETIKSLLFSLHDLRMGSFPLDEKYEENP